jgi:hypothetical protein
MDSSATKEPGMDSLKITLLKVAESQQDNKQGSSSNVAGDVR